MLQVLESSDSKINNNDTMLTNGSNQYIQPDYLTTTLDSKRSPLALLAQTCSQIGADPTPSTTTSTTLSSSSSTSSSSSSSSSISVTKNLTEKPSKKSSEGNNEKSSRKTPPQSTKSQQQQQHYLDPYGRHESVNKETENHKSSGFKSPSTSSTKSSSNSATSPNNTQQQQQQQHQQDTKFMAEQRLALDMAMQQQQQSQLSKDIQQSMLAAYHHRPSPVFPSPLSVGSLTGHHHPLSPYHHPGLAGLDAATAAALGAFRHPAYSAMAHQLSGGYPPHHHVPVSLGLSLASYQQALSAVSYGQRLQTKGSSDSAICRDPYCTGCPANSSPSTVSSSHSPSQSSSSPTTTTTTAAASSNTTTSSCPAGCTQCDHMTRTTASSSSNNILSGSGLGLMSSTAALSSSLSMSTSTPSTIVTSSAEAATLTLRPYVCNWIASDHYCGKRFTSSEELLQHLRTHTSLSVPPVTSAVGGSSSESLTSTSSLSSPSSSSYSPVHHHQLLNPSLHPHSAHLLAASAAAALHRTYPTPPLSPLSMARYHPYSTAAAAAAANAPGGVNKHLSSGVVQHSPLSSAPPPTAAPNNPSPLLSLHHPYAAASLAAGYYHPGTHPYSLYSQRMLAGAGVLP